MVLFTTKLCGGKVSWFKEKLNHITVDNTNMAKPTSIKQVHDRGECMHHTMLLRIPYPKLIRDRDIPAHLRKSLSGLLIPDHLGFSTWFHSSVSFPWKYPLGSSLFKLWGKKVKGHWLHVILKVIALSLIMSVMASERFVKGAVGPFLRPGS